MMHRTRVFGARNGPLTAQVLFIAEAPGRLGADLTGLPLMGDRSGQNFDDLLRCTGFSRGSVFITNAVVCNPRDHAGRNDRPSRQELLNCSGHLQRLLAILDPAWVVPLGEVALNAVGLISSHGLRLRESVGRPHPWFGRRLFPLYHPSPRAMLHRPIETQRKDYRRLGQLTRCPT
jgi:uracil-DNA glycosylase family 4